MKIKSIIHEKQKVNIYSYQRPIEEKMINFVLNKKLMETTRQLKVASLLKKEFSDLFIREGKNYSPTGMITVTKIRVTPDLLLARVYLSLYAMEHKEELIKTLNDNKAEFRYKLGNRIKTQVRNIPHIEFYLDDSLDYLENIEKLLKQ